MLDSKIITRLAKTDLDLEEYYILYSIHNMENWHKVYTVSLSIYIGLVNRRLLDKDHVITNKGIKLMHKLLGSGLMPAKEFEVF